MKYQYLILIISALSIYSCQNDSAFDRVESREALFQNIYNDDQIKSQFFNINSKEDTSIICENGTIIRIYANSFKLPSGSDSIEVYQIEIKEAFKPIDFVLGNLTTVCENGFLQSGGMIYINAIVNGKELILKDDKEIGVIVPIDSLDEKMMVYKGERDSSKMNWFDPKPMLNSELRTLEQSYVTITYQWTGEFTDSTNDLSNWLWEPNRKVGDKTIIEGIDISIIDIAKDFVSLKENTNGLFIPEVITRKGQNGFVEDFNTSYIFKVKKLGWANIDKLFDNPNSEKIELMAKVSNEKEFGYVFTSLILPKSKMYIPGYQKMDNSFSFSHNDSEEMILPIGEEAIIMSTAYKNDKPFFSIKKLIIKEKMDFTLTLIETTPAKLKKQLDDNI